MYVYITYLTYSKRSNIVDERSHHYRWPFKVRGVECLAICFSMLAIVFTFFVIVVRCSSPVVSSGGAQRKHIQNLPLTIRENRTPHMKSTDTFSDCHIGRAENKPVEGARLEGARLRKQTV